MSNTKKAAAKATPAVRELPKMNKQQELVKQIQKYQEMARMVKNRARFVETLETLEDVDLKASAMSGTFEDVENFKLLLKSGYNTEILSVSNSFILGRFLEFMKKEIQTKISELDVKILG